MSSGPMVSVWWDDEPRFYGDLNAGYLAVNDQGPGISLSGTQVAVLAVACVFNLYGAKGLVQHPALHELRGYVSVRAR